MCMTIKQFIYGSLLKSSDVFENAIHSSDDLSFWTFLSPKNHHQGAYQCLTLIVGFLKLAILLSENDIPYFGDGDLGMASITWMALMSLGLRFIWWPVKNGVVCMSCSLKGFSLLQIVVCYSCMVIWYPFFYRCIILLHYYFFVFFFLVSS